MQRALLALRPLSLAAAAAVLLAPGLWLGPGFDASVYVLAGIRIRDGYMPYTGLFDNKPPGLYLVNAFGQAMLPWLEPWHVSWLLTLAFTAGAILVVDRMLRRLLSPPAAFLASLVCLVGMASYPVAFGGGLTESFAILPVVLALWVVSTLRPGWRTSALVACLGSLASLLSLQELPVAAILVLSTFLTRQPAEAARRVAAAIVAGAVAPFSVACWLIARGAMGDAVDQLVTYNVAYRDSSPGLGRLLPVTFVLLACLLTPVAITVARMVRHPRGFDRAAWLCLLWLLSAVAVLDYENRLFLHYLILAVPPMVILSAPSFGWLMSQVRSSERASRAMGLGLVALTSCMFAVSAMTIVGLVGMTFDASAKAQSTTEATADWIKANTPASATIFNWGNDTYLYLLSDRAPYDSHVYQFPMVTAGYWSPALTESELSAWIASPPAVIVESPANVPMFQPRPDPQQPPDYDTLAPLRDFARDHYRLAATFGDHYVYTLIPRS